MITVSTAFSPTIALLGTLSSFLPAAASVALNLSNSGCLCTSDQPCWPSAATFTVLESQLSQPLVYPVPTAWSCYPPSDPAGNCTAVADNWQNGTWRSGHPGSLQLANWEAFVFQNETLDACYLNTTVFGTCGQGRVPAVGVDARSVADIQAAIRFAIEYGLKLVVKSTGHDLIGRSSGKGTFMVWTHRMKNITYDTAFVPQGGPTDETYEGLTVSAGVQWNEAYNAVHQQNRLMVGGVSSGGSVGAAGGWLMGGGHSFVSPSYGLGVDNALEISVVLSTGEYLVTNAYQNSDLFWALRGGGGGTYGIVTSVTYRTYPEVPFQIFLFQANVTNSSALPELVEGLLRHQTNLSEAGWGGYGIVSSQGLTFGYYAPNMTNETVATSTQTWHDFVQSLAPYGVKSASYTSSSPSWYDLIYDLMYNSEEQDGVYGLYSSRLVSRHSIATNLSQVAQMMIMCPVGYNAIAGGRVSQIPADSAGLNPAWRNAVLESGCAAAWDEETPLTGIQADLAQLRQQIQVVHDTTPSDGAYLNEASEFEIDPQYTFFGSHYDVLKSIKDKYDPYRLFVVAEGVGSEEWNKNLTCRF